MALTICHTGDWHLGHTLYRRGREHEHAQFLAWLLDALEGRAADALVIAGDVFESGSPPGSALAMFYGFLADARRRLPALAIVVVAGNHDSPARLAAPDPILRGLGVSIVGSVAYEAGAIACERMVIPVVRAGRTLGRIVAVPFLRGADLPALPEDEASYARGARRVYDTVIEHARVQTQPGESIVVTGHFAAAGARMSRESERLLAMGLDGTLPIDVIDTRGVAYVALGHLHLAQQVPAPVEVRYAGSPIPLSFAERELEHAVRFVTMEGERVVASEPVAVRRSVPLVRIPDVGLTDRAGALAAVAALPPAAGDARTWPLVEVRVSVASADRDALEAIESAAADRAAHLVHVLVEREGGLEATVQSEAARVASLDVRDVLVARWMAEHGQPPPDAVLEALSEATAEARLRLEQKRQRLVELEADRRVFVPAMAARRRELED